MVKGILPNSVLDILYQETMERVRLERLDHLTFAQSELALN